MKTLPEEDVDLLKSCKPAMKSSLNQADVFYTSTYDLVFNGIPIKIVLFGKMPDAPIMEPVWASAYIKGSGCFLARPVAVAVAEKQEIKTELQSLLQSQNLAGSWSQFGIKEKGIK